MNCMNRGPEGFAPRATIVGAALVTLVVFACPPTSANDPGDPFGFRALEIFKATESASVLVSRDLNGDGRLDLVYADNDDAAFKLLVQRGPTDAVEQDSESAVTAGLIKRSPNEIDSDHRFKVETVHTGKHVQSFAVGDLNADDRPDIAYYADPPEFHVVYNVQPWGSKTEDYPIRDGSESPYGIEITDLNGDGRSDLILLGKGKSYLFTQKEGGGLAQPVELALPVDEAYDVEVADLNSDDRADLIYVVPDKEDSLVVQLQGPGGFGPSRAMDVKPLRSWLRTEFRLPGEDAPRPTMFGVERASDRLKAYRWSESPSSTGWSRPLVTALGSQGEIQKRRRVLADVDGDGRRDLVVSRPGVAQIAVSFQDDSGTWARRTEYSTLSAVSEVAAADVDGDGRAEIIVVSRDEKTLGVSSWSDGRLQYPATVTLDAEPLHLAAGPAVRGEPGDRLFIVYKREKLPNEDASTAANHRLERLRVSTTGESTLEVGTDLRLKSTPSALRILDANGDASTDVLLTIPYAAPRLFVQKKQDDGSEAFADLAETGAAGLGQLARLEPSALRVLTGRHAAFANANSKRDVLLVVRATYVRALQLDDGGALRVIEQFAGRGATTKLVAAATVRVRDDEEPRVVLFDSNSRQCDLLARGEDGGYTRVESFDAPSVAVLRIEAVDVTGDDADDLVFVGSRRIAVVRATKTDEGLKEVLSYSIEKKEDLGSPQDLTVGDLNGDGREDVVVNTAPRYNLLCLAPSTSEQGTSLKTRLAFPIFEEKSYMRRSRGLGPRHMDVADVDGDGLKDLILMVHDRILIYLQDLIPAAPGGN